MRKKYRPRAKSFHQGLLSEVGKYFEPLIDHRPQDISFMEWIENYIFHTHERHIDTYIAMKEFRMPGLYYWLPTRPIAGYGRRAVALGRSIVVRTDSTKPNIVDVETVPSRRDQPRTFRLTAREWKSIKPYLTRKQ